jgi:4-amino-4-deoxy-L-arabinose transferase-like glycosyltransferase
MGRSRTTWLTTAVTLAPAAVLAVVFALSLPADPLAGITGSVSPFGDEGGNVLNARNLVLLGHWSTDDWNLYLVNFPFSAVTALAFWVGGVGTVQARIVSSIATILMIAALGIGLRRHLGPRPAVVAATALAATPLLLFYGRLAYLEDFVALFLVLAVLLVPSAAGERAGRFGLLAGALLAGAAGVKPSALFAIAGVLAGVLLAGGLRGPQAPSVRRWLLAAGLALCAAAAAWLLLVWLPNRSAIEIVLRIWPTEHLPTGFRFVGRVTGYLIHSDGALPLTFALLLGAAAGTALAIAFRERLSPAQRLLLGAAAGWFVAGMGVLLAVQYRPNRYVVPLLPALAILLAIGWWAATRPEPGPGESPPPSRQIGRRTRLAAIALAGLVLVAPGAVMAARFAAQPSTMTAIQAQMLTFGIDTPLVGGVAPTLAMRVPQPVIVAPWPGVNVDDQYVTKGARWVIAGEDGLRAVPAWVSAHATAWAARRTVACYPWVGVRWCLYHLP